MRLAYHRGATIMNSDEKIEGGMAAVGLTWYICVTFVLLSSVCAILTQMVPIFLFVLHSDSHLTELLMPFACLNFTLDSN